MNKIPGLLGKEEFIKEAGTHEGEKVSMDFLLFQQKVHAHFFLCRGCFTEQP